METLLLLDKPIGMTPLQLIQQYKTDHPEYADVKMGYAGRLDPMAEGLVLIMVGDEAKNRDAYQGLDKEYEVRVLLGVSTDSYDLLGLPVEEKTYWPPPERVEIEKVLRSFVGTIDMPYPPYSSKPVDGRPLYAWAKEGKLSDITIPSAQREIYSIEYLRDELIETGEIDTPLYDAIPYLRDGDFRVDQIMQGWQDFMLRSKQETTFIFTIRVSCSSGTYMRTLAHEIGNKLGIPTLAYAIKRTRIGDYELPPAGQ